MLKIRCKRVVFYVIDIKVSSSHLLVLIQCYERLLQIQV